MRSASWTSTHRWPPTPSTWRAFAVASSRSWRSNASARLAREHLARAEAEQANVVRDALLVRVCHDLRTPLNTIMGWAHILRTSSPASATVARGLETIARNAEVQTQLLEDVLDASRAMARSLRLETDDVDFVVVIQAAIDAIRPEAEARGVQLGMVMDLEARLVTGDTRRLRQAVSHLLANAVRVTPSGGRVDVRLERAGDQANLTVRDGGRAVAPDVLPVASDPLRPAGIAISQPPGFSLDLWIVRHLVELHGGSVEAESAGDGEGTSITARLPLAGSRGRAKPLALASTYGREPGRDRRGCLAAPPGERGDLGRR